MPIDFEVMKQVVEKILKTYAIRIGFIKAAIMNPERNGLLARICNLNHKFERFTIAFFRFLERQEWYYELRILHAQFRVLRGFTDILLIRVCEKDLMRIKFQVTPKYYEVGCQFEVLESVETPPAVNILGVSVQYEKSTEFDEIYNFLKQMEMEYGIILEEKGD
jgi:hypothetical protein